MVETLEDDTRPSTGAPRLYATRHRRPRRRPLLPRPEVPRSIRLRVPITRTRTRGARRSRAWPCRGAGTSRDGRPRRSMPRAISARETGSGGATVKTCRRCGLTRPPEDFRPAPKLRDSLSSWCVECHRQATRDWRARNPEQVAASNAARRVKHAPRRCSECGETFIPVRRDSQACSPECSERRHRRIDRRWPRTSS
jgi:hypothetical protein